MIAPGNQNFPACPCHPLSVAARDAMIYPDMTLSAAQLGQVSARASPGLAASWGRVEVLFMLHDLRADGNENMAFAAIDTQAAHSRSRRQFGVGEFHQLVVGDNGKIASWAICYDPG
jgi:hypothetical protein